MKINVIRFTIIAVLLGSCHCDPTDRATDTDGEIAGTWHLKSRMITENGNVSTQLMPGHDECGAEILELHPHSSFKEKINCLDQYLQQGYYEVNSDTLVMDINGDYKKYEILHCSNESIILKTLPADDNIAQELETYVAI